MFLIYSQSIQSNYSSMRKRLCRSLFIFRFRLWTRVVKCALSVSVKKTGDDLQLELLLCYTLAENMIISERNYFYKQIVSSIRPKKYPVSGHKSDSKIIIFYLFFYIFCLVGWEPTSEIRDTCIHGYWN